jgi:hypothetical protein
VLPRQVIPVKRADSQPLRFQLGKVHFVSASSDEAFG